MKSKLFEKVAHTPDISREEWLKLRKTGVGGSDAGAIAGLNNWSSAFTVYCDKLGLIPEKEDSELMRQGRDFEDYVAKRFVENEGKQVKRFQYLVRSKLYPFALADVDRVIVGENAILECKTTSVYNKTDFENGDIPKYWYCQCQHYLAVTGCDVCYLAVLILSGGYHCFKVNRNEEDIQALMELESKFWNENVLKRVEPAPDGSNSTDDTINQLYGHSGPEVASIDLEPYRAELTEYEKIVTEIKSLSAKKDKIEQEIKLYLKDAPIGQCDGVNVSWKSQVRTGIDSKKLKAELPEIYNKYLKITASRPFRITFKESI